MIILLLLTMMMTVVMMMMMMMMVVVVVVGVVMTDDNTTTTDNDDDSGDDDDDTESAIHTFFLTIYSLSHKLPDNQAHMAMGMLCVNQSMVLPHSEEGQLNNQFGQD